MMRLVFLAIFIGLGLINIGCHTIENPLVYEIDNRLGHPIDNRLGEFVDNFQTKVSYIP